MNKAEKTLADKVLAFYNSPSKNNHNFTREDNIILERWRALKIINEDAFIDATSFSSKQKEYLQSLNYPFTPFGEEERKRDWNLDFRDSKGIVDEANDYPPEITLSIKKFRKDYPDTQKTAFIIMRFGKTPAHRNIVEAIKQVCNIHGIAAVRADDKEYHSSLLSNVLTYIYGCDMSVAVFERIEADNFNPNVSFEVGYMRALKKPVCLLKDQTMSTLQTDLLGELYKSFDPQDPKGSIPVELEKWLKDKDIG